MANQAERGTVGAAAHGSASADLAAHGSFAAQAMAQSGVATTVAGHAGPYPSFHGRTVSWVAVSMVMVGFLVGGLAMVFGAGGPIWWLFWTGIGISVLGLLVAAATRIFDDWY